MLTGIYFHVKYHNIGYSNSLVSIGYSNSIQFNAAIGVATFKNIKITYRLKKILEGVCEIPLNLEGVCEIPLNLEGVC